VNPPPPSGAEEGTGTDAHRVSLSPKKRHGFWLVGLVSLLLGLGLRFHNLTTVLVGGHFYFIDADCYSRLSRVRMVLAEPTKPVRQQFFENWPEGVRSHATAPLDYLIAGLERLFDWGWPRGGRFGALAESPLDLAGAVVSPLLGMALVLFVWVWAARLRWNDGTRPAWWWAPPLLLAASPSLVHATVFGRPDHQSLLVLLLGVALAAEQRLLQRADLRWGWAGGFCFGMALWVSLYEPAVLLGGVVATGLCFWRPSWTNRARLRWACALVVPVVAGVLVDGIRFVLPEAGSVELLQHWLGTVGELAGIRDLATLSAWGGHLWAVVPVGLAFAARRRDIEARGWLLLLVLGTSLCIWQIRWAPYWVLLLALSVPVSLATVASNRVATCAFLLAFLPFVREWRARLSPDLQTRAERHLDRSEWINARRAAERMRSENVEPFLAVWWLSPALAYWSGQPAVAGSGHEGIDGIVDSARFFLSTDPIVAREILSARRVRTVVASDSARAVENASRILNCTPPEVPLAERLWRPDPGPEWGLKGETNVVNFRLLRLQSAGQDVE
jgi:hypothetical protein